MNQTLSARVAVIGAGPSGITAAKNLLQVGLKSIVVFEKGDGVGGNWIYSPRLSHSSVFETTHIISSKRLSQYEDFPMPRDYPDYPSHRQLLDYFRAYADHFGVTPLIRFNTGVERAEKQADETWRLTLSDGSIETFDTLLVANGHHWDARMPTYPGQFNGEFIHSHDFKNAEPYRDRRVLVIGGGNSACDIAVETSRVSQFTGLSWRRGYYIVPKIVLGQPTDVAAVPMRRLPRALRAAMMALTLKLSIGNYRDYGLPQPKHGLMQAHLVVNSELLYVLRHGKIHPRPDIARLDGDTVHFTDGRAERYDVMIAATGFNIRFPFFDPDFIDYSEGRDVPLYLRMMHPDHPSLFFIGLVQPLGCIWPLSDHQSRLAANAIVGRYQPPADIRARIQRETAQIARDYIKSPRHTVEVEYHPYRAALLRAIPASAPAWNAAGREKVGEANG